VCKGKIVSIESWRVSEEPGQNHSFPNRLTYQFMIKRLLSVVSPLVASPVSVWRRSVCMCCLVLMPSLVNSNPVTPAIAYDKKQAMRTEDISQRDMAKICQDSDVAKRASSSSCVAKDRLLMVNAQYVSNVCYTPVTYCFLPQYAPIGSPCWCATPYGPSYGYVR
jgi:hypothetical protein